MFVRYTWLALSVIAAAVGLRTVGFASAQAPPNAVAEPTFTDSTLIARGAYLAKLGDCAACHTATKNSAPFAGGLGMNSPFGTIYSTNITPDPKTGIGHYTYADFERALRDGVAPGGKHLYPAMPYPSFAKMTDADVHALYAYFMQEVQAATNQPPRTSLPFPFNQRWGLFFWNAVFLPRERSKPDAAQHDDQWIRGAYLTQSLGHCGACHTPRGAAYEERGYDESSKSYLTGGFNDNWFAPNLTGDPGSGLGRLSERDIESFLKTGHGVDVHIVAFGSMASVVEDSTQHFSDEDLKAIAHYLKSLPANKPSGGYQPGSQAARQTAVALRTGDIQRPGSGLYASFCMKCHRVDGRGQAEKYPALAGNPAVLAPDTSSLVRLILEGGKSPATATGPKQRKMPAFADQFTDTEIARVLTFVRTTWGNQAKPVTPRTVAAIRGKLKK